MEKHYWSQYLAPNYPVPFIDQLKQLVELHQAAEGGLDYPSVAYGANSKQLLRTH